MTLDDFPPGHFHASGAAVQDIVFPYTRSADQDASPPARHRIVIVGAGRSVDACSTKCSRRKRDASGSE